jgi:hypothetical protein
MLVIDISGTQKKYRIGDLVSFKNSIYGRFISFKFGLY